MMRTLESGLEKMDGFETEFVKLLYYDIPPNYVGEYKTHSFPRLCTILEGEKKLTVDHKHYKYDRSKSLILPSHTKVIMEIERPTKALVFEFSDQLIDHVIKQSDMEIGTPSRAALNELILNNQDNNLMEDLNALIDLGVAKKHREKFLIDIYAQKLVYSLLNYKPTSQRLTKQLQHPVYQAMEMMSGPEIGTLTLSELAKTFQMSESNFSQQFKKYTGVTPQKYLTKMKLERALELLKLYSVTEVSFELGFESPSHFIRLFKQAYDTTPKQYQLRGVSTTPANLDLT
ncbi:MAG: hypothetical protein PWQ12_504 [Clostridiales bacterium]|nr:hypothetical protein [Clostridiales bacterium]